MILIASGFFLVCVGMLGVVLPLLPGVPIAWLGLLVFAFGTNFVGISVPTLLVFFTLSAMTVVVDIAAPLLGAKQHHATKYGVWGGIIGSLASLLVFGPVGLVLGPIIGVFFGEIMGGKQPRMALRVTQGTVIGTILSLVFKLVLVFIMFLFLIAGLIHFLV